MSLLITDDDFVFPRKLREIASEVSIVCQIHCKPSAVIQPINNAKKEVISTHRTTDLTVDGDRCYSVSRFLSNKEQYHANKYKAPKALSDRDKLKIRSAKNTNKIDSFFGKSTTATAEASTSIVLGNNNNRKVVLPTGFVNSLMYEESVPTGVPVSAEDRLMSHVMFSIDALYITNLDMFNKDMMTNLIAKNELFRINSRYNKWINLFLKRSYRDFRLTPDATKTRLFLINTKEEVFTLKWKKDEDATAIEYVQGSVDSIHVGPKGGGPFKFAFLTSLDFLTTPTEIHLVETLLRKIKARCK